VDIGVAIKEAYRETDRAYRVLESRIGCVVALFLVPAGMSLDYFVYPDKFVDFFLYRLLCDFFIGGIYFLHFTRFGVEKIAGLTLLWLIAIQVMISYMIYLTDGVDSPYYAGLNLSIIAIGILLPTSVIEAVAFCGITIGLYVYACYAYGWVDKFSVLYNNLYFIVLSGVIGVLSVLFNTRRRFSEFRLSYELEGKNKQLSELDRIKSQFFANVSHELRTPLTLILVPAEDLMAQKASLSPAAARLVMTIHQNALRLLRLVNNLLEINRLEENRQAGSAQLCDMNKVVAEVVDSVAHLAVRRKLALQRTAAEKSLQVCSDHHDLEKVIINLLSNAIKFTPPGGSISVHSHSADGMAYLTVKDSGIGIPKEEIPFIFDRFRQADGSSTRRYQGTGLGLALVKELVEKQGGSVVADSREGVGTTMKVALPLVPAEENPANTEVVVSADVEDNASLARLFREADRYLEEGIAIMPRAVPAEEAAAAETALEAPEPAAEALPQAVAEPAGVLVVEDEADMRSYLVEALAADFRVVDTEDGREAVALAKRMRPAVILLDYMIPGMNGLAVCQAIRELPELADTKVVLLTARGEESTKLKALASGADDFLVKPFGRLEVQTRLRNLARTAVLQRDLRQLNGELQETLHDLRRTRDQLVQSEKLNAAGVMAAGLLHEVNNPLNFSSTTLQVLLENPEVRENEPLLRAVERIRSGIDRVFGIINSLRTFVRPSVLDLAASFSLAEALHNACVLLSYDLKHVELHNEVAEDCLARGGRSHIERVLVNLLSNAAKAVAGRKPGIIRVSAQREDGRVLVRVWDNGHGIKPADIPKVFDPFFTTADVGEGMGMGLSICHAIITHHGGQLRVASQEGQWTEFTFDLAVG
jgi:signal transduction histidine kinase